MCGLIETIIVFLTVNLLWFIVQINCIYFTIRLLTDEVIMASLWYHFNISIIAIRQSLLVCLQIIKFKLWLRVSGCSSQWVYSDHDTSYSMTVKFLLDNYACCLIVQGLIDVQGSSLVQKQVVKVSLNLMHMFIPSPISHAFILH